MKYENFDEIAAALDISADSLEALVVGVGSAPTLAWLFENVREFCEEIQPRSLLELRSEQPDRQ